MDRFEYLLEGFVAGSLTNAELEEFAASIESNQQLLETRIETDLRDNLFAGLTSQQQLARMLANIRQRTTTPNGTAVVIKMRPWIKWVAAACIILLVSIATYTVISKRSGKSPAVAVTKQDIAPPKETRAVITLADGRKVYLDSANNGTIAQENNVNVLKTADGKIVYDANSDQQIANSLVYNTLTNPRGSKVINMTLSDGSHVWLNAGSSVKYPVAFIGNERKVEITGEAYFEVAHDASKPFHVTKGETDITVLGTHFNVNAYDDEDALRVTLLEGSVKVSAANKTVTIKPGEQAQMNGGNAIGLVVNRDVDVDEVMAWKNGLFQFSRASLQDVMKQIARWYDVDVSYEGKSNGMQFGGKISRDSKLSEVLRILELSNVRYKIEGRKVTVMQ